MFSAQDRAFRDRNPLHLLFLLFKDVFEFATPALTLFRHKDFSRSATILVANVALTRERGNGECPLVVQFLGPIKDPK